MLSFWQDSSRRLSLPSIIRHIPQWRFVLLAFVFLATYQFLSFASLSTRSTIEETEPALSPSNGRTPFDMGRVTDRVAAGHVLVTGGGGNIGKHIVRRLLSASTPVTLLDATWRPDELLPSLTSSSRSLLKVVKGDIRNTTLLSDILTPDIVGIVHLGAVSRVLLCLENEADCWDINERGTKLTLEALSNLNARDNGRRWFVLASSREVYGDMPPGKENIPFKEDTEKKPVNAYGASKLASEKAVEAHLEQIKKQKRGGSIHAIALRLSNVYGSIYDHVERLLPSIATQALSHQLIQISGGEQHFDLLHIDDCVDGFLLAVKYLTSSLSGHAPRTYFNAFNLASGFSAPVSTLVSTLVKLARSKSPIQYIPGDNRFPNTYRGSAEKAQRILGYEPQVNVEEGLERFVRAFLQQTEHYLSAKIGSTCGKASPSIEESSDENLNKLDGCTVHVSVDIQREFAGLFPPKSGESDQWTTGTTMPPPTLHTDIIVRSDPQPVKDLRPPPEERGEDHVRPYGGADHHSKGERVLIRIKAWDNGEWVFLGTKKPESGFKAGSVTLQRISEKELGKGVGVGVGVAFADWELEANPEQGTVRLAVPGTNLFLKGPTFLGKNFTLAEKKDEGGGRGRGVEVNNRGEEEVWPMKISPSCCPAPAPWPFFHDNPIDYTIEYQKTSLDRPFLASPAKALCNRLRRAKMKVTQDLATLSSLQRKKTHINKLSSHPIDWSNANLPACSNACDHPTICVDTGDCQCVLSTCPASQRFPFWSFANLPVLSYPPPSLSPSELKTESKSAESPLVEAVKRSSWRNVLRAQASRFVGFNISFPRIYVAPLSNDDEEWVKNWKDQEGRMYDIGALREKHCLSADAQLERGVKRMGVPPPIPDFGVGEGEGVKKVKGEENGAEIVFVPHYEGRWNSGKRIQGTYEHTWKTVRGFDASKVIIPFTFDWGLCLTFEWNVWKLRRKHGPRLSPILRSTTAWSVMADLNSPCYRPHQDIVIPPRTCLSKRLLEAYPDISDVRPARDRRVLVAFSGSLWGTGFLSRQRVECPRHGWSSGESKRKLHLNGPLLKAIYHDTGSYDYINLLNDTIFCPQPAGTTGWSTRLVDSIYAGCVPVIIGRSSHYPFFDMIDWSKISVTVESSDLPDLENVLLSRYTLEDIERLQANMMLVRDAFVYPLDDVRPEYAQKRMLDDRGPLYFALQSTRMRMMMQWPADDVVDRP
ncbi:uncharacterized protein EI90DRAFT_3117929 [Cantharellus anzutake]|uniref:uncharacterized protein n=1 Tax=Cantharellus anzutake TaxID=1750568 RepID=UPI0019081220|nr:uncharacterized protein EI90DRAFT_3117929 [Cantharellus anzutake]KAF8338858.1 hypothetical protein EI90DRAFT_3117929 [Cantharellus anzutake]